MQMRLSGTGLWSGELRYGDAAAAADAASELDELGFDALWIPDVGGPLFGAVENLLAASKSITIATGILNIWMHEPGLAGAEHARLVAAHGDRFLMGLGVSHRPLIDTVRPGEYEQPLTVMRNYLDGLDAAEAPVAVEDRVLAALGPKMLELARQRSAGTHPYLVTPEHTAVARERIGPGALVLPEQAVVLETDADAARAIARQHLAIYLGLPNYANNWRRGGFSESDIADGGSDRLVDALVVWGGEDAIRQRVQAHRDAGADHVCLQLLSAPGENAATAGVPIEGWRRLAAALS